MISEETMATANSGFTVKSHFDGKDPAVRKIYDRVLKAAGKFGPVVVEPKKTSIHLVNKTAFAGVATRKSAMILTIKSDRKIPSPRIHKSEQTSTRRFHHEVKITSLAEVNSELVTWLKKCLCVERIDVRQTSVCRSRQAKDSRPRFTRL